MRCGGFDDAKRGGRIGLLCHHFDSPIVETYRQPAFEFVDVGGGYIFLAFDDGNYHIVLLVLVVHGAAVAEGDISNLRVLYAYFGSNLRGGNVFAMVDVQLFLECGDDAVFLSLYFVPYRFPYTYDKHGAYVTHKRRNSVTMGLSLLMHLNFCAFAESALP